MTHQNNNTHHEINDKIKVNFDSPKSHILFGFLMKETLIPVDLEVESSFEVGKGPPKLDVLIIRRMGESWTEDQLYFLPDGVRQKNCKHVILELKYTESVNQIAIYQALGYFGKYVSLKKIPIDDAHVFIVCSKTPEEKTLNKLGFEPTDIEGVYQSNDKIMQHLSLISLNDLSNAHYNLLIKLFSSKKKQKIAALKKILFFGIKQLSQGLIDVILKIIGFWNETGEYTMQNMKKDFTPELFGDVNEEVIDFFIYLFRPEKLIQRFKPEDRLKGLKPEDRFKGLKIEDRLNGLSIEEIEQFLQKKKSKSKSKS